MDSRAHGESGGRYDNWTDLNLIEARKQYWPGDLDTAFHPVGRENVIAGEEPKNQRHPVDVLWRDVKEDRARNSVT